VLNRQRDARRAGLGSIAGAQGDYFQATRGGGNGDYHVIVLAPNSVEEWAISPSWVLSWPKNTVCPA
jgi:2-oxoglutarate ferredoxin oxidoreductase subunit alpha